jgi:uncharacterized membrane protein
MYELLLAIHLLAAIVWIGGGYALTVIGTRAAPEDRGTLAPYFNWYGGKVIPAAAAVLILAGIGLVLELDYAGFGDLWIILAIVGWLISGILGTMFIGPTGAKLESAATPEEAGALYGRLLTYNYVDAVVVTLVVIDMVVKPGS